MIEGGLYLGNVLMNISPSNIFLYMLLSTLYKILPKSDSSNRLLLVIVSINGIIYIIINRNFTYYFVDDVKRCAAYHFF